MEKKTETKINENGSFCKKETIRITPEDGIVSERSVQPAASPGKTRGKYRAGHSVTKTYSTNDPRVTRLFTYLFSGLFFLIGILLFLVGDRIFGFVFITAAVLCFVISKRDIDAVSEKLKQQGQDVSIDSPEELESVLTDTAREMKNGFQEVAQETFTKDHLQDLTKKTLPIYCILALIVSLALGLAIHVVLGILVFLLFCVIGVIYYGVFLPLLGKFFKKQ